MVQWSHLSLVLISLQPHHPHPQMSWGGCKKMWKLERHDRPFRSLTAEDNLWLSTVIKAREAEGEIPQRISPFPFQQKSLNMAVYVCCYHEKWNISAMMKTTEGALKSVAVMTQSLSNHNTTRKKSQTKRAPVTWSVQSQHKPGKTQTTESNSGTSSFGTLL